MRKRWADPVFVRNVRDQLRQAPLSRLQNLDLRGVPKLGSMEPLYDFDIRGFNVEGIDLSFGDGALIVSDSKATKLRFEEFRFDRASFFRTSIFDDCDFRRARLRLDASDCEFNECRFDLSTFAGGFSEYGFTRCVFSGCSFRSARWKGTYFKACTFDRCDLTQFQIIDSTVLAIRHRACVGFSEAIFSDCEIRTIREIA